MRSWIFSQLARICVHHIIVR